MSGQAYVERRRRARVNRGKAVKRLQEDEPLRLVVSNQDKQLTYLGTVIIHAGQDIVHEVKPPAGLVGKNEACTHDRDFCMLDLQHWSRYCP